MIRQAVSAQEIRSRASSSPPSVGTSFLYERLAHLRVNLRCHCGLICTPVSRAFYSFPYSMLILATYSPHCLQIAYCTLTVQVPVQSPVAYINAPVMPLFLSSRLLRSLRLATSYMLSHMSFTYSTVQTLSLLGTVNAYSSRLLRSLRLCLY